MAIKETTRLKLAIYWPKYVSRRRLLEKSLLGRPKRRWKEH